LICLAQLTQSLVHSLTLCTVSSQQSLSLSLSTLQNVLSKTPIHLYRHASVSALSRPYPPDLLDSFETFLSRSISSAQVLGKDKMRKLRKMMKRKTNQTNGAASTVSVSPVPVPVSVYVSISDRLSQSLLPAPLQLPITRPAHSTPSDTHRSVNNTSSNQTQTQTQVQSSAPQAVEQLHPMTREILRIYPSLSIAVEVTKISIHSLNLALDGILPLVEGFAWRYCPKPLTAGSAICKLS
jgi:hypothetical protein